MSLPTSLEVPNIAIAGTDALAADVNEDFDYITTAQNATNVQVNTNTDEITTARNGAASLDARLDAADADRALKAYANNAALTGIPVAPTAAVDTDTTQLATTAFAKKEADDAQSFAIQRANHTGTQPQSTIDNLTSDLAGVQAFAIQRTNHTGTQPQSSVDNLVSDLASKISADNAALTGIPTAPTAANGTKTTQIATTEFVGNAAFNSALPDQTGNAGKFVTTDGTDASWGTIPAPIAPSIIRSARTSNTMLDVNDSMKLIDITSGTFTQTFGAAATLDSGWYCYIRNSGTGDITLDPDGSELIDGLASYIMYPREVRLVQCDGTTFRSIVLQSFFKTFTSSGTFVKPPGYNRFESLLWSGGWSGSVDSSSVPGGTGGGCFLFSLDTSLFDVSESIIIGAGGLPKSSEGIGFAGGNSFIGSLAAVYAGTSDSRGGSVSQGLVAQTNVPASGFDAAGPANNTLYCSSVWGGAAYATTAVASGNSVWGGAAGGSYYTTPQNGGTSIYGGNGGAASNTIGVDGTAPGGGGGACLSSGTRSGAGARGECRIWGII